MNSFKRLMILSNEVEVINAIIDNKQTASFDLLFEGQEDLSKEFKLDKLCEILYKVYKSIEVEDEANLLRMFEEYYGSPEVGEFCVAFIKMNLEIDQYSVDEKVDKLLTMNPDCLPNAQIKIDYLQMLLSLLLSQFPLNLELINQFNNKLKGLLVQVQALEVNKDEEE